MSTVKNTICDQPHLFVTLSITTSVHGNHFEELPKNHVELLLPNDHVLEGPPPHAHPLLLELPNHMPQDELAHIDHHQFNSYQLSPQKLAFVLELTSQLISVTGEKLAER